MRVFFNTERTSGISSAVSLLIVCS